MIPPQCKAAGRIILICPPSIHPHPANKQKGKALGAFPFFIAGCDYLRGFLICAWAAAMRAMGTRKGLQET